MKSKTEKTESNQVPIRKKKKQQMLEVFFNHYIV